MVWFVLIYWCMKNGVLELKNGTSHSYCLLCETNSYGMGAVIPGLWCRNLCSFDCIQYPLVVKVWNNHTKCSRVTTQKFTVSSRDHRFWNKPYTRISPWQQSTLDMRFNRLSAPIFETLNSWNIKRRLFFLKIVNFDTLNVIHA